MKDHDTSTTISTKEQHSSFSNLLYLDYQMFSLCHTPKQEGMTACLPYDGGDARLWLFYRTHPIIIWHNITTQQFSEHITNISSSLSFMRVCRNAKGSKDQVLYQVIQKKSRHKPHNDTNQKWENNKNIISMLIYKTA